MATFYKFVTRNGMSHYQNFDYKPFIKSGEWMEVQGTVRLCDNGFHASTVGELGRWYFKGARLFEVEYEGRVLNGDEKVVGRKMRFVREMDVKEWLKRKRLALNEADDARNTVYKKNKDKLSQLDAAYKAIREERLLKQAEVTKPLRDELYALGEKIRKVRRKLDAAESKVYTKYTNKIDSAARAYHVLERKVDNLADEARRKALKKYYTMQPKPKKVRK